MTDKTPRDQIAEHLFERARARAARTVGLTIYQLPSVTWATTDQDEWLAEADALIAAFPVLAAEGAEIQQGSHLFMAAELARKSYVVEEEPEKVATLMLRAARSYADLWRAYRKLLAVVPVGTDETPELTSTGQHQKVFMYGGDFAVCDTCINGLNFNIRWDQAHGNSAEGQS